MENSILKEQGPCPGIGWNGSLLVELESMLPIQPKPMQCSPMEGMKGASKHDSNGIQSCCLVAVYLSATSGLNEPSTSINKLEMVSSSCFISAGLWRRLAFLFVISSMQRQKLHKVIFLFPSPCLFPLAVFTTRFCSGIIYGWWHDMQTKRLFQKLFMLTSEDRFLYISEQYCSPATLFLVSFFWSWSLH